MSEVSRLEARAYGLLVVRRTLTQSIANLTTDLLWRPPVADTLSLGDLAREAWQREAHWLWPPEIPAPTLEERPGVRGTMYALVRVRAVTEEMLMQVSDEALDRVYVSQARSHEGDEPTTLATILDTIMHADLYVAAQMQTLRSLLEPGWPGVRESWDNAVEAVAESRITQ
ncbi:MAG: hypothetical protein O7A71_08930 [Chloroflexi bacterium]|nr:hypothetical protein [Chloroflexota bacterium]